MSTLDMTEQNITAEVQDVEEEPEVAEEVVDEPEEEPEVAEEPEVTEEPEEEPEVADEPEEESEVESVVDNSTDLQERVKVLEERLNKFIDVFKSVEDLVNIDTNRSIRKIINSICN